MKNEKPKYKRIILKLSGQALQGEQNYGIDLKRLSCLAEQIKKVKELGVEVAVVVGGGNIIRGATASEKGINRVTGDYMGMLATVINALALQDALERTSVNTRVMSAIEMKELAEPYIRRRAIRHLEKGRVVIFAGGIGNPYFTTDTASVLRAIEIHADVLLKATQVDGVYDADPAIIAGAKKFTQLDYKEVLSLGLQIMDSAAISLCMDNDIPIVVFNIGKHGNILRAVVGEEIGTFVRRLK